MAAAAEKPIEPTATVFNQRTLKYYDCEKGIAFANLKPLLNPGGVLFGSTVLRRGVRCDPVARGFLRLYNAGNAFHNLQDSLAGLKQALEKNYRNVWIDVVGCVAQFSGTA